MLDEKNTPASPPSIDGPDDVYVPPATGTITKVSELIENMDIVQQLGDSPGIENDLSPQELKAVFDRAGNIIKAYLNGTIVPFLNNYVAPTGDGFLKTIGGLMKGIIDMGFHKITNVSTPTNDSDAATKRYVDNQADTFLETAKRYADGTGNSALSSAKSYADSRDSSTLSSARSYADSVGSSTLSSANSHADSGDSSTLASANASARSMVNSAWRTALGTLTRGGWSGRWQNISCPGLTTSAKVIASADGNSTSGTRAWQESDVWAAQQVSGAVRFYYYGDAPSSDIPVVIHYEVGA